MCYYFFYPPPSLIVLLCHAFFIHEFSCPVFSVCRFTGVKVASVFLCGAIQPTASQCVHTVVPSGNISPLVASVSFFFKAFICSEKRLISCWCQATRSTEISRLAANSASGPPFFAICIAAAAILSRYPSSESVIWSVSGAERTVFWCSRLRSGSFAGAALNIAEPPKGSSSPSRAASARLFAT